MHFVTIGFVRFVYRHLQKYITKTVTVIILKMYGDKHTKR